MINIWGPNALNFDDPDIGRIQFIDGQSREVNDVTLHRGTHRDWPKTHYQYIKLIHFERGQPSEFLKRTNKDWDKPLPAFNREIKLMGFDHEGSLLTWEPGRGLVIRHFDVSKEEILQDLAKGFSSCNSTPEGFTSEEDSVTLAHLYHRFKCLDKVTKKAIYEKLAKILSSSFSLDWWRFKMNDTEEKEEDRAKLAFYNGKFGKLVYDGDKHNYTASPQRIGQAITEFVNSSESKQ